MAKAKKAEDDIPFDTKALAVGASTGAVANVAEEFDYEEYEGQGFENHSRDDYAVPFLGVLQSNSPLVESNASARPGMLVNTVTQQLYDGKEGVLFIPAHTVHNVLEWKPRNLGGGFVAAHDMKSDIVQRAKTEQEFGKWKTVKGDANSNDLIETQSVYGIFLDESGSSSQMIISFSSTKLKSYKAWMTKARTLQVVTASGRRINPPLFAHKYRITSIAEKNAKGSFFNLSIDFDGKDAEKARLGKSSPLFQAALSFAELLSQGDNVIKSTYGNEQNTGGGEEEEVPFK